MKRLMVFALAIVAVPLAATAASAQDDIASIRAQFREIARLQEIIRPLPKGDSASPQDKALYRQADDAERALLKIPVERVLAAFDQSIRSGDRKEIAGALAGYDYLIPEVTQPDPRYKPVLLELLAKDDFSSKIYTNRIAGFLRHYSSRETMLAYMDAARRSRSEGERLDWVETTAALLGISFNYTDSDPPERRLREVGQFENWYEKNKDRIRFDSKGEPHYGGGPGEWKPPRLTSEDRVRIKQDPACVLRLFGNFTSSNDPDNNQVYEMNARCGQALLGKDGSAALARVLEQTKDGSAPGLDLQMAFQSAAGNYATSSAVLAAAAYVAADSTAGAEIRKLAKETVEDFGEDLDDVLKPEPSSVKKKVRELLDEPEK